MRSVLTAIALSLALMNMPQSRAQSAFEPGCNGKLYDVQDHGELARFDAELRQALKGQNVLQLAALVNYPLRVNGPGRGTILISDPQALKSYFQTVFTPQLRARLLKTTTRDVSCMVKGIMYGGGELWAQPVLLEAGKFAYRVDAINLLEPEPVNQDRLDFVCETAYHRIVIDTVKDTQRYRSWNKPRSLTARPDVEIGAGSLDWQGTGVCAYSNWSFRSGTAGYVVHEASPCGSGDETVASRGSLDVVLNGKTVQTLLCQ
ncbi:MAG TPA: hypothetical protein V6D23_17420 [Candidatus Obscuribacterales bacterium]